MVVDHLRSIDKRRIRQIVGPASAIELADIDRGLELFLGLGLGACGQGYRRVEGAFARVSELSAERGTMLTTPRLPGFAVSLVDLFAS